MEISVDQFEKAKEANQKWNTAMSEQAKVGGKLKLRLSGIKPVKDRVMTGHVPSGWLASSYPIRRAFLQHRPNLS